MRGMIWVGQGAQECMRSAAQVRDGAVGVRRYLRTCKR